MRQVTRSADFPGSLEIVALRCVQRDRRLGRQVGEGTVCTAGENACSVGAAASVCIVGGGRSGGGGASGGGASPPGMGGGASLPGMGGGASGGGIDITRDDDYTVKIAVDWLVGQVDVDFGRDDA